MPLNPGAYLHRIFASGCFPFFSLISAFSTAFHFPLPFLSHTVFIMMCSAIKYCWWLWHSVSQVTLAEALFSRTKLESIQRQELVKKFPFSAQLVRAALAFPNQWSFSDSQFCSPSIFFLSSCRFRNLNFQFLTDKVKSMSKKDSALWRYLRPLNQGPKYKVESTEDQCSDGTSAWH